MQRSSTERILAEIDEAFTAKTASAKRAAAPAVTGDVTQLVEKLAAAADSLESGAVAVPSVPSIAKHAEQTVIDKLAEAQVLSSTLAALAPSVLEPMIEFAKEAAAKGYDPHDAMKLFLEQKASGR